MRLFSFRRPLPGEAPLWTYDRAGTGCCTARLRYANWLLPRPFRDHFGTFRHWIDCCRPQPEDGVARTALLDSAYRRKVDAYAPANADRLQCLWAQEYV